MTCLPPPYRAIAAALAMASALAGCATVTEQSLLQKGVKPFTAAEMKDYFSRARSSSFVTATNATGRIRYATDGSVTVDAGQRSIAGKWRLSGDEVCTTYTELRNGREGCVRFYRTGPKEITTFWPEGPTVGTELD